MFKKYLAIFIFVVLNLSTFTSISFAENPSGDFPATDEQITAAGGDINSDPGDPNSCSFGLGVLANLIPGSSGTVMGSIGNCVASLLNFFIYYVFYAISGFFAYTASVAGRLMNYVLFVTVVNFTTNFTQIPSQNVSLENGGLIYYAWSLVRDVLNAGVFFVIIYHAILAMFNGFADIKKKFIALLMFVVLVNFSLLFVKVVADISNIAILQMYEVAIKPVGTDTYQNFTKSRNENSVNSLSEFVLNSVKPFGNVSEERSKAEVKAAVNSATQTTLYQFGLILVYAYMTFLFLYISAILFTRAATFIVIMVVSPLLVAGAFFSGFEQELKKVKNELFEEAFQGPGIIFFLLLSSLIGYGLFNLDSAITSSVLNKAGTEPTVISSNLGMFLRVVFFAIFNIYAFKFIRDLTTRGNNFSEKFLGVGLTAGFGLAGFGAKKMIGGGANRYLNGTTARKNKDILADENSTGKQKAAALRSLRMPNYLANKATYSVNGLMNKKVMGQSLGSLLNTGFGVKVGLGAVAALSYGEERSKKDEKMKNRREDLIGQIANSGSRKSSVTDSELMDNLKMTNGEGLNAVTGTIGKLKQASDAIKNDNFALKNTINSTVNDSDKITYNGVTYSKKEWKALMASETFSKDIDEKIAKIKGGGADKAEIIEEYIKKGSKRSKEAMEEMMAEGKVRFLTETPADIARFISRIGFLGRENSYGDDYQVQNVFAQKIAERGKVSSLEIQSARNLHNQSKELSRFHEKFIADQQKSQTDFEQMRINQETTNLNNQKKFAENVYANATASMNFIRESQVKVSDQMQKSFETLMTETIKYSTPDSNGNVPQMSNETSERIQSNLNEFKKYVESNEVRETIEFNEQKAGTDKLAKLSEALRETMLNNRQTQETSSRNSIELEKQRIKLANSLDQSKINIINMNIEIIDQAASQEFENTYVKGIVKDGKSKTEKIKKEKRDEVLKAYEAILAQYGSIENLDPAKAKEVREMRKDFEGMAIKFYEADKKAEEVSSSTKPEKAKVNEAAPKKG